MTVEANTVCVYVCMCSASESGFNLERQAAWWRREDEEGQEGLKSAVMWRNAVSHIFISTHTWRPGSAHCSLATSPFVTMPVTTRTCCVALPSYRPHRCHARHLSLRGIFQYILSPPSAFVIVGQSSFWLNFALSCLHTQKNFMQLNYTASSLATT